MGILRGANVGQTGGISEPGAAWATPVVAVAVALLAAGCATPPDARASRPDAGPAGDAGPDAAPDAGGPRATPWTWTVACPDGHDPTDPVDYGRCAVAEALAEAQAARAITIATIDDEAVDPVRAAIAPDLDPRAESFVIAPIGATTWIVGRDPTGAMYGALEIAERLRLEGAAAVPPASVARGAPTVAFRAANLFWVLPDTLPDGSEPGGGKEAWWFLDEGFWRGYLDLLAHARLDVLDVHGMYDVSTTAFPNALLYLARSASFPDVGVPPADRDRNLAMLNRVIAMAAARGIRVGLMTYQASSSVDGYDPEALSDADLQTYVREAAADVAARAPGLAMLGFRTGESGRAATWYENTFVAGVQAAAPGMTISTRTWQSSKPEILALASSIGPNMVLEAKFNGEHLGPPYAIAGGQMATWGSYSYQTYLNPPRPWTFVFQVRAGGTHQIFRQASYARAQRTMLSLAMSPAIAGFTLEPPHAYTPQEDFYHANAADRFSPWAFARDDLMYLLWGRLGYDPTAPEDRFRQILAREAGTDSLWPALQAASDIVPWIVTGRTCGADSRQFEPEMELGGDVAQWAGVPGGPVSVKSCDGATPFDTFAIAAPAEVAGDLVAGARSSKLSPLDVAAQVLAGADLAATAADRTADAEPLVRDLAREAVSVADLGRYFGHKLRGATALAVYAGTGAPGWLDAARAETGAADDAWRALALDTAYIRPFYERLRMQPLGYDPFHWSLEVPALAADTTALAEVGAVVAAAPPGFAGTLPDPAVWLATPRAAPPALADLSIDPADPTAPVWLVRARFAAPLPDDATVSVLWKPFDSETDWSTVAATPAPDGSFAASIDGGGAGALFAVEVRTAAGAWRLPDPMAGMPYVSLPP
ncbi:MAG TPA: hypothetical protein VKZ18_01495 [Polyangia bacterium]|nr:hypothetical protein [Polyangia bacterium]